MDKIFVMHEGQNYTYRQVCVRFLQFCHTNPQIYAMNAMYSSSNPSSFDNNTYPTAQHGSRRFYIGNTLGGVSLDPLSRQIVQAKAWQLVYQMNASQTLWPVTYKLMREMERQLLAYDDDLLDIAFLHSMTLNIEVKKNSTDNNLALRFIFCAFMLWFFACFCSITTMQSDGKFYVDWSRTKFTVATCGLLGAVMGIVTGIGFLTYCQYAYNSVVDAMPFLVLGVRLDNTFLMISAVHHTKRHLSAQERLSEAMSEAAVSITITVLTDILSFATGLITDFYSVIVFSVYTIATVSITFAYQLTFLLGVLALSLKNEQNNVHSVATCREVVDPGDVGKLGCFTRWFCLGSISGYQAPTKNDPKDRRALALSRSLSLREQTEGGKVPYQEGTWISRTIRLHYAPFLMRLETKVAVFFIYVAYLAMAIYGCVTTRQGLEPMRLLVQDSYAIKYYIRLEQYFWHVGTQAQLVFSNAGDLSDPDNRRRIMQIINQFANSSHVAFLFQ
uniref:SSD domain-containing protein n=1 Tax=Romanomermis culicivorax TaxID=13658 RepID=A0A915HSA6_ROMCU